MINTVGGEGLCPYRSADTLYVFAISRSGVLRQYALMDSVGDGRYEGRLVLSFAVGSEAEGCAADAEGVTVVAGYVIVSAQFAGHPENSFLAVYDRTTNAYMTSFRVETGTDADNCDHTDGITAYARNLGPLFPSGLFVCHYGRNTTPGSDGARNFELVPFGRVSAA